MNKYAVVSLYNTPSGMFSWWDQFPSLITERLTALEIDHFVFYREFTENSIYPIEHQHLATNTQLNSLKWLFLNLLPLCKKYQKVIIHTHSYYPPLKIWLLTYLLPQCEWHITEHRIASGTISKTKRQAKILLRKRGLYPKHVIGVSNAVKDRSSMSYGSANIKTIYNGIDLSRYSSADNHNQQLIMPLKCLYIGRMDKKKGVVELIEAFKILKRSNTAASLTIVGGGKILPELKAICSENELCGNVEFAGHQSDVLSYYQNHHVVIIPTQIEEALSLVAIEAKAMGLPVIYANKGGLPEVFEESQSGILLPTPSPVEISNAVRTLVEDQGYYKKLASLAKSDINRFAIETMIDQYINHYQQSFK